MTAPSIGWSPALITALGLFPPCMCVTIYLDTAQLAGIGHTLEVGFGLGGCREDKCLQHQQDRHNGLCDLLCNDLKAYLAASEKQLAAIGKEPPKGDGEYLVNQRGVTVPEFDPEMQAVRGCFREKGLLRPR